MPIASLPSSPLVPGVSPIEIYYREEGEGPPLVLLHGGWGGLHPFDRQLETLREESRVVCPDRCGYGRSSRLVEGFSVDFHYRAAAETLSLLDALGIERAFFWGHSDGAVIAAILGFTAPERVRGLVLEAFHYFRLKPRSREFFEALAYRPETLDAGLSEKFANEFGEDYWREIITSHAKAWIQIALEASGAADDLYRGRLHEISVPTIFIHGALDPRTEPGELDAVRAQLPRAEMRILEGAGHSPHSEKTTGDVTTRIAREFIRRFISQVCSL